MVPVSGKRMDMTMRMVVVFPAPLEPMSPMRRPLGMARSRLETATFGPKVLVTPRIWMALVVLRGKLRENEGGAYPSA